MLTRGEMLLRVRGLPGGPRRWLLMWRLRHADAAPWCEFEPVGGHPNYRWCRRCRQLEGPLDAKQLAVIAEHGLYRRCSKVGAGDRLGQLLYSIGLRKRPGCICHEVEETLNDIGWTFGDACERAGFRFGAWLAARAKPPKIDGKKGCEL